MLVVLEKCCHFIFRHKRMWRRRS